MGIVEDLNFGSGQSTFDEEQAVISDVNINNGDEETASQSNIADQIVENRRLTTEEASEEKEADNSEELDEEAVDNPSGTVRRHIPMRHGR